MKVLVFGNAEYKPDSLPLFITDKLRCTLPDIEFILADPNEEWPVEGSVTVLDTVINLKSPRIFDSLDAFESAPRVSMHDFDALMQLRLLKKIGKIDSVRILGLPPQMNADEAILWVAEQLRKSS